MHILEKSRPILLSVLRIVASLLFIEHGTAKLFHFPHMAMFDNLQVGSFLWAGGIIELVGGTLVLMGFFTRYAAVIVSGEMAVAYFMYHARLGLFPALNGGDAAILFCFVFLYIAVAGPGPMSLDRE